MIGLGVAVVGAALLFWFDHGWLRFLADCAGLLVGLVVGLVAGKAQSTLEDVAAPALLLLLLGAPAGLLGAEQLFGYVNLSEGTFRDVGAVLLYFLGHAGLVFLGVVASYLEGEGLQTVKPKARFYVGLVPGFFVGEVTVYALTRAMLF